MEDQSVDYHLRQALSHLDAALDRSISQILEHPDAKKTVGPQWEAFLGAFLGGVRDKGKQSRINLLSFISFPRIR